MDIKTFSKQVLATLISIFVGLLIVSTFYYFDIISSNLVKYLRPLLILLILFMSSYNLGKKIDKKGYLEGFKLGSLIVAIFLVISLIFFRPYFKLRLILYYLILIITTVLGSMIGINKEKK